MDFAVNKDLRVKLELSVCCEYCGVPTAYYEVVTSDGKRVANHRNIGGVPYKDEHPDAKAFFRAEAAKVFEPNVLERIDWDASDFSEAEHRWDD